MQTPPPPWQHALPPDPPAIVEFAEKMEEAAETLGEDQIHQSHFRAELEEATDRLADEAARPVIDRRKKPDRPRDKRGR